ncbi:hypothetical protein [Salipiger abyssi]|uniref:Uncharacterized protein n=1 Tax=Salipiger abyssi TaxID=1250539 RepID=A0A1P8UUR6_9RHOB|nr:hypothetical protein [Salipiger abyssi]APZ53108.1 hypothetical protein Ga0080574_TMP2774 [Salipiger abyssi]
MQNEAPIYPRGKYHQTPEAIAQRKALADLVWAKADAEKRAKREAQEAFIGPRQRKPRRPLAPRLVAHIESGGCSGDRCRTCNGQGWQMEEYDRGQWTEARCFVCRGTGLGS